MNTILRGFLGEDEEIVDNDPDNTKLTALERNLKRALQKARDTMATAQNIENERQAVLVILKKSSAKHETITQLIQKYVDKEEKGKVHIFKELEKLRQIITSGSYTNPKFKSQNVVTDVKLLKTMVATVRVEIEHMQKKIRWKDDQITDLLEENAALRQNGNRSNSCGTIPSLPPAKSTPLFVSMSQASDSSIESSTSNEKMDTCVPQHDNEQRVPRLALKRNDLDESHVLQEKESSDFMKRKECSDCGKCISNDHIQNASIGGPNGIVYRMHETNFDNSTHSPSLALRSHTVLPDIHEQRCTASSCMSRRRLSVDLATLLDNSMDNCDLEKVVHMLSQKAEQLPPARDATSV